MELTENERWCEYCGAPATIIRKTFNKELAYCSLRCQLKHQWMLALGGGVVAFFGAFASEILAHIIGFGFSLSLIFTLAGYMLISIGIIGVILRITEVKKPFDQMEEVQVSPHIKSHVKSGVLTPESTTDSTTKYYLNALLPEGERVTKVVPSSVEEILRELQTLQESSRTGRIVFLLNQLEKQSTLSQWAITTARKFINHPDSEIRAMVERISQRKESKYRRVIIKRE